MRNHYKFQPLVYRFMVLIAAFLMVLIYNSTRASGIANKGEKWEKISMRMKKKCIDS